MGFIADVFDVTLIDPRTNDVFAMTTLQDANIEFELDENEIRGGRGNTLLGVLKTDRDVNISLTEVSFRYDWLARQLGSDVVTGEAVAYARPKFYKVEGGEITLPNTPLDGSKVAVYSEDGEKLDVEVVDNNVTVTGANDGDDVEVRSYTYQTSSSTEQIEFDINKFPKGVIAVLETIEIDGDENITHKIQYQFENAVPDGNATIETASEREATAQEFNLRVIKPKTTDVIGRALRIPYEDTDEGSDGGQTP